MGLTKEQFLQKANIKYNSIYTYNLDDFKNGNSNIQVFCEKHGAFECIANRHLDRRDCSKCKKENYLKFVFEKGKDYFLSQAKQIHNNHYSYNNLNYTQWVKPVIITCKIHGDFRQFPSNHLKGAGCKKCAQTETGLKKRLTTNEVIKRIKIIHKNKYDLSLVDFKGSDVPIVLVCKDHGQFNIRFSNIYSFKQGCPKCVCKKSFTRSSFAELSKGRKSYTYLVKLTNSKEIFYKIGITVNIKSRFTEMKKLYKVELIDKIESTNGVFTFDKEIELHRKCKTFKYKPILKFGGCTECFKYCSEVLNIFKSISRV